MNVPEWIEKIGRTVFEGPFNGGDAGSAPELAEIRLAVLDAVRERSQRVSGRQVFPYNAVTVLVRGIRDADAGAWRSPFLRQMLEREIRIGLTKARIHHPDELTLEINSTPGFPMQAEPWVSVDVHSRRRSGSPAQRSTAKLIVVEGRANAPEIPIDKARTNIGRTVDVHRADGPSRRNDLAFSDDSAVNRTVSREHAHILFSKQRGEYRLFNDRIYTGNSCGLWILRDGLSQAVHRDSRGVRLIAGDEIHFGSAVVRFQLK